MITDDDYYRVALKYLKKKTKKNIRTIAEAAGVSNRHIQAVMSDKEKKSASGAVAEMVAKLFGTTYLGMVNMGRELSEGGDPNGLNQTVTNPINTNIAARDNYGSIGSSDVSPEDAALCRLLCLHGTKKIKEDLRRKLTQIAELS